MKNNKLIDPELEPLLQLIPDFKLDLNNLKDNRDLLAQMVDTMKSQLPEVEGVAIEDHYVSGPMGDPDVKVRVYKPEERTGKLPGLLWIHGGGYVLGSIDQDDITCKHFVEEVECIVVSVEYRLAPEHPYPAPVEDCYAALTWMFDHTDDLGIENSRLSIGGASAGGGLAAGLALLARDRAEVEIIFQLLIYPMIDDCNIESASKDLPDTLIWSRHNNLFGWTSYLDGKAGGEGVSPYAAAARITDLNNLPSTFIAVGDIDLFVVENIEYAKRLIQAGVPTELHVYPGAFHGFNSFVPSANVSKRCNVACNQALKLALHR